MSENFLDNIEGLCTYQSYNRGERYYKQGKVLQITVDRKEIEATVKGTKKYNVLMTLKGNYTDFTCTCPYDW